MIESSVSQSYLQNPMDRVFSLPELLQEIFSHTDKGTDACCARVCKQWFNNVIPYLWHTMDDLKACFTILSPIVVDNSGIYKFEKTPLTSDWSKFYEYSCNIKSLVLKEEQSNSRTPRFYYIFQEVSRSRTQLYLFPRLNYLKVFLTSFIAEYSALYLNRELTRIEIEVTKTSDIEDSLTRLFDIILKRIERLSTLSLSVATHLSATTYDAQLQHLFSRHSNLRHVTLTNCAITSPITSSLSSLLQLEYLRLIYINVPRANAKQLQYLKFINSGFSRRIDSPVGHGNLVPNSSNHSEDKFPRLRRLILYIHLPDLNQFFTTSLTPRILTHLQITIPSTGTVDEFRVPIEAIGSGCTALEEFHLYACSNSDFFGIFDSNNRDRILELDEFSPLFNIPSMRKFSFIHSRPISINESNLENLATSWTQLDSLHLNASPKLLTNSTIGLVALDILAKHSPNLRSLQLYLDVTSNELNPSPSAKMLNLKDLFLSNSQISNPISVFRYLRNILPSAECLMNDSDARLFKSPTSNSASLVEHRYRSWEEVRELLVSFERAAGEQSHRVKELEAKVYELGIKNRGLEKEIASLRSLSTEKS